jgi:hypothetical protein
LPFEPSLCAVTRYCASVKHQYPVETKVDGSRVKRLSVGKINPLTQCKVPRLEVGGARVTLGKPGNDACRARTIVPNQGLIGALQQRDVQTAVVQARIEIAGSDRGLPS